MVNTQGRESGGSWFETCSGVWYPRRRPCGVAINTLVDLNKLAGETQVFKILHAYAPVHSDVQQVSWYASCHHGLYLPTSSSECIKLRMIRHSSRQIHPGRAQSRSSPMQLHLFSCSKIPVLEDMCQRLVLQTQSTSCMACKGLTWTRAIWCQFGIVYMHPCKRYPPGPPPSLRRGGLAPSWSGHNCLVNPNRELGAMSRVIQEVG